MSVGHAVKDVLEVGVGLTIVELGCGDQRADGGPAAGAAVGACEQVILSAQGDRPNGALDGVGVELDPAILKVEAESLPSDQGVADGVSERAARRHPMQLGLQPGFQCTDQRLGQLLADRAAQLG